ncbi:MAG: hypothetical protein KDK64_07885 [Chlamydiia bacterium]|nr:hypothetical protein [Chlamydiia bacterium]
MKRFALLFFLCVGCTTLFANDTFSKARLDPFFDDFTCEEKNKLGDAGLTDRCTAAPPHGGGGGGNGPFVPPPNPPPPPFPGGGLLPIVIVNNSGYHDEDVYIVVTGVVPPAGPQAVFLDIAMGTGIGTLVNQMTGQNSLTYTKKLSELPMGSSGRVFYTPALASGVVWFSMEKPLSMPVLPAGLQQPNFLSPSDPNGNYLTNFDIFEFTYNLGMGSIFADATAVSFHSIPLYGYISTPASGSLQNTGLFQPRSFIMSQIANTFASFPTASEWFKLILKNGSDIVRVVSTGKSMSVPSFDINYLDNPAAYGYSYINDIWSGASSFYRTHTLKITANGGSNETYTGVIQPDNSIVLTSSPSNFQVVLSPPRTTPTPTTSQDIFSGTFFIQSDTSGMGDGVQMSLILEQGIIAGVVPTTQTLSQTLYPPLQKSFYTTNPSLTAIGQATGPWYDVYSKALHHLGYIYTFAFDEFLWPEVQIISNSFIPGQTYLGITIGNVTD